jgi:CubicO group peptidase (beta-lactamase class C family)
LYPENANNGERKYHTITRGWIGNEIFRRVEKDGKTMAEFFYENLYK